jgi:hypothetical protein
MSILESIKSILKSVWNYLKKIYLKIVSFFKNIVSFFKEPNRLKEIKENQNIIAVAIKENLKNGEYTVINCLFDKEKEELVNSEEDTLVINAENLDQDTKNSFGNKEMVILN